MKRIYKGNDAVFNLISNTYPFDINSVNSISFNFYTTNHNDYITKTKDDINEGVLILKWNELEKLEEGVLFYDYVYDNNKIVTSKLNISEYYIATGKDLCIPKDGKDGVSFIPEIDDAGYLSWTNNGSLPNPKTVNVKGQMPIHLQVEDGNLYLLTEDADLVEQMYIDENGDLIYEIKD